MTAKEYLRQAYRLENKIKMLGDKIATLRLLATSVSSPGFEERYNASRNTDAPQVKAIENKRLSTEEAVELIKGAGGIAVLAHPRKIKGIGEPGSEEFKKNFEQLARSLKKMGVKGIECIYPTHTEEDQWFFVNVAGKLHMHVTEGSDFHGKE